jgi:predicted ester cyclase
MFSLEPKEDTMAHSNSSSSISRVAHVSLAALALATSFALGACATTGDAKLVAFETAERTAQAHVATFDALDFDVFTHQKWDRIGESHAADILVHWPDGHTTKGVEAHVDDLKAMFVYAPDTRISAHPVRIAAGEWTAVTGTFEGTFTQPMPIGGGKTIPATGKAFKLTMATLGHWKNGVMDEEYLFWDGQTFMKQLGLAP